MSKKHQVKNHRLSWLSKPRLIVAGLATIMIGTAAAMFAHAATLSYYVSPNGLDTNDGATAETAFKTIQKAMDVVGPGATINLAAGTYSEQVITKTDGTAENPITIQGPETGKDVAGRYQVILNGLGVDGHIFDINNSYYTVKGFTIDGQKNIARSEYPTDLSQARSFKDSVQSRAILSRLIYVGASDTSHDITGVKIDDMFMNGGGGECVRFRNRATNNLVNNSVVQWCGMFGAGDDVAKYKYHNAEGIYVGTSPKSTTQPMYANDTSSGNVVRNTSIRTFGSECFNVKENAHDNVIQDSECMNNDEPTDFSGSNLEFRGDHNQVENTIIRGSRGYGVKLKSDSSTYDKGGNAVRRSAFSNISAAAITNDSTGVGEFCGNTFSNVGSTTDGNSVGDPKRACVSPPADTVAPTVSITAPTNNATVSGNIVIKAAATDNAGVTKVEFLINDALLGTVTAAPYEQAWTVPATAGATYRITAKAYDAKGNVGTTQITVTKGADVIVPSPPTNPTGQAVSPTEVQLSWSAAPDNVGTVSYDVYRNSVKVTNTAALTYNDVGLSPNTTYTYYIKAVDASANQSAASSSISIMTPPSSSVQGVSFEAETGTLKSPMIVQNDPAAQGGKYIVQTSSSGTGQVTYSLTVPTTGTYKMMGRVIAPTSNNNAFGYSFDGATSRSWDLPSGITSWTWATGPTQSLTAGTHSLVIYKKDGGTKLDAVSLTLDTAATTPTSITATSLFDAEVGSTSGGMTVQNDSAASGGKYILAQSSGTVTYSIKVAASGNYMVAGWIKAPNSSSDTFNVKIDSGSYSSWDLQDPTTSWTYDASNNPVFNLSAGTHTFTLQYREANASVDRLVFVKQ